MSQETKKVLEMLAAGQISTEDAEKLLEKLGANGSASAPPAPSEQPSEAKEKGGFRRVWGWTIPTQNDTSAPAQKLRFLRVVVESPGRDQVNVRVPLAFIRAGMKLFGVIPPQVSEKLAEKGIDLSALRDLKGGELVEELKDLHVDVDGKDGEKVRVYCE